MRARILRSNAPDIAACAADAVAIGHSQMARATLIVNGRIRRKRRIALIDPWAARQEEVGLGPPSVVSEERRSGTVKV